MRLRQHLTEKKYATITQLMRLERMQDEIDYEASDKNRKKYDKLENQIYNVMKRINKSQNLIDAYETEYGLEWEFDE